MLIVSNQFAMGWTELPVLKTSKEEGKDQELIQSSITSDPRHHMGKWQNTKKHHTQESQEVSPFPAGDPNTFNLISYLRQNYIFNGPELWTPIFKETRSVTMNIFRKKKISF